MAGGSLSRYTEIYNTATREWREGPTLPQAITYSASVQYEDTFLLLGGYDSGLYLDTIYQYNQTLETWILRPETLSTPKYSMAAIFASPPVAECN